MRDLLNLLLLQTQKVMEKRYNKALKLVASEIFEDIFINLALQIW